MTVQDELIRTKVCAMDVPASIRHRVSCEHVHGYQLVEMLLPICLQYGLVLTLSDGDDKYPINSPADIIPVMSLCDIEWLYADDGEVDVDASSFDLEAETMTDTTCLQVALIYGNRADDPETGRGEMVADWSASCTDWWDIFDPALTAFIHNR